MSSKKKRRKSRKTKRKGGNRLKKLQTEAHKQGADKIIENRRKNKNVALNELRESRGDEIKKNLPTTEKAIKTREERKRFIYKDIPVMGTAPLVDQVKNTNWLGLERSKKEIINKTTKKQNKSNKKFYTNLKSELNKVITDPSHPNYFNYRRTRILEIIKENNLTEYNKFKYCRGKRPSRQRTGCSKQIYESIEVNGQKRGKDLLDTIAKKYDISLKDEKYKKTNKKTNKNTKKKGGRRKRRTKKRKSRKRR